MTYSASRGKIYTKKLKKRGATMSMTPEKLAEILAAHKLYLAHKKGGSKADLSGAGLRRAYLRGANLSGATGLLPSVNFLEAHFERTDAGYIAYKTFNVIFASPAAWGIKGGAIISENVNFDRCTECGCGINVAPLEWVKREYGNGRIWKVLIRWEWLCGVCVPYMSDGKIRCERVELLEVVCDGKEKQ